MIYYYVIIVGAKADRIANRRGGGKPDSKQPPRGMRAIIRWNSSNLPVGPWSTRLNAYIGVLVRRATIINPYFQFRELPWSAYEAIWTELMVTTYCYYFLFINN